MKLFITGLPLVYLNITFKEVFFQIELLVLLF